jgi:hypothetical protein
MSGSKYESGHDKGTPESERAAGTTASSGSEHDRGVIGAEKAAEARYQDALTAARDAARDMSRSGTAAEPERAAAESAAAALGKVEEARQAAAAERDAPAARRTFMQRVGDWIRSSPDGYEGR